MLKLFFTAQIPYLSLLYEVKTN